MKKQLSIILIVSITSLFAQNIDIATLSKGQAFKLSGGVSSNFIYFDTNRPDNALLPFTYFFQGNLNFGFYQFNMPVSYSYSNQGDNFTYRIPFNFNRLSLHPKYRWITAHIGDVSMNFSPYTLNGHQFTGGGLELNLSGGIKFGVMAGRLLKATEDDNNIHSIPAFNRMGYGSKIGYEKDGYQIAITGFYAKDNISSLRVIPEEKNVLPKENLALSIEGKIKILKDLQLKVEYASSAVTQDLRASANPTNKQGLSGLLFDAKNSTEYYTAFKSGINYKIEKTMVSLAYERIDPGYQTLGAYYFNNDLENITLNASKPMFNNKLNLTFNIGYQKDNLNFSKLLSTNRMVGAINLRLQASEKLTITGNYSNFSTYTNKILNKLNNINNINTTPDEIRKLDYKQLSQNANFNANLILSQNKKKNQSININYSLASTINEQGGIIAPEQENNFHNLISSYNIGFPEKKLNITGSFNYIYNDMGISDGSGWGGVISLGKRFFDNKLNTSVATGYNNNNTNGTNTNIINLRMRLALIMNKHQFNLNAINLIKNTENQANINELRINFGYTYSFDVLNNKKNAESKRKNIKKPKQNKIPTEKTKSLSIEKKYQNHVLESIKTLYDETLQADEKIKTGYLNILAKINSSAKKNPEDIAELKRKETIYNKHKWIMKRLEQVTFDELRKSKNFFADFKKIHLKKIEKMLKEHKPDKEITAYLRLELVKFLDASYEMKKN